MDVVYEQFRGKNNRVAASDVPSEPIRKATEDDTVYHATDLSEATNIDINNGYGIDMRPGQTLKSSFVCHSAFSDGFSCLCVKGGTLYSFLPGEWVFSPLLVIGDDTRMRYTAAAGRIYFTNGSVIGEYFNGVARLFGRPTDPNKGILPAGQAICFFRGHLYTFCDNILYESDTGKIGQYDLESGLKRFPEEGVLLAPCLNGLYAGTTKGVYFGEGSSFAKMPFVKVSEHRAFDLPVQYEDASQIDGLSMEGRYPVFMNSEGPCLGLPSGQIRQLPVERYKPAAGTTGASIIRKANGQHHYIAAYR